MLPDQLIGLAAEHRRDLLNEAERRRLATCLRADRGLRGKVGDRLVSLGWAISGERGGPRSTKRNAPTGKEVREWKQC